MRRGKGGKNRGEDQTRGDGKRKEKRGEKRLSDYR